NPAAARCRSPAPARRACSASFHRPRLPIPGHPWNRETGRAKWGREARARGKLQALGSRAVVRAAEEEPQLLADQLPPGPAFRMVSARRLGWAAAQAATS